MSEPEGPSAAQLAAVNEAQTPEDYAAAAKAAGLTADAEQAAAAGAAPVQVPDFAELIKQYQADQQAQIDAMQASFNAQLEALRAGLPVPTVDPSVNVVRNLTAGISSLTGSYPNAQRVAPLAKANDELAAAVAEPADGGDTPAPDAGAVANVIKLLRRVTTANPQLETGILEHAAQLAEDTLGL